jgi:hypothetical protein
VPEIELSHHKAFFSYYYQMFFDTSGLAAVEYLQETLRLYEVSSRLRFKSRFFYFTVGRSSKRM